MSARNTSLIVRVFMFIKSLIIKTIVFVFVTLLVFSAFRADRDIEGSDYELLKNQNFELLSKIEEQESILNEQEELLNSDKYDLYLARIAEEERIAAEKAAEEARIAAEKAAEEARIAAEKAAEEEYISVASLYTQIIGTYLSSYGYLMTNNDLLSSSWRDDVQVAMDGVSDNCDGLSTIATPNRFAKVQNYLKQACVYYSKAMIATENGIDNLDANQINAAGDYLTRGNVYINLATAEIDKESN